MRPRSTHSAAFTLVELLVVIGIITILIAVLLPALTIARRAANDIKCRSNIRQVCTALINYASENKGKFPPNIWNFSPIPPSGERWNWWCDADRIGRFLPKTQTSPATFTLLTPILVCPEDEQASRSYAMNYYASSAMLLANNVIGAADFPRAGRAWSANAKESAKLILIAEALSFRPDGLGGYMSWETINSPGVVTTSPPRMSPAMSFVGDMKVINSTSNSRYAPAETEFDWSRHRRRGDGGTRRSEARGRSNIGFADGHVESFSPDDLANRATKRSRFVALWSPLDYAVDALPRPF